MTPEPSPESSVPADETGARGDQVGEEDGARVDPAATHANGPTHTDGTDTRTEQTGRPTGVTPAEEINWRGWLLVGLVFVCFLVVPAAVLYLPAIQGVIESLGLSMRQAYLALPMIPAIVLGVTAVWAAVRTQTE